MGFHKARSRNADIILSWRATWGYCDTTSLRNMLEEVSKMLVSYARKIREDR